MINLFIIQSYSVSVLNYYLECKISSNFKLIDSIFNNFNSKTLMKKFDIIIINNQMDSKKNFLSL